MIIHYLLIEVAVIILLHNLRVKNWEIHHPLKNTLSPGHKQHGKDLMMKRKSNMMPGDDINPWRFRRTTQSTCKRSEKNPHRN